jgi:hypothetical protein
MCVGGVAREITLQVEALYSQSKNASETLALLRQHAMLPKKYYT